MSVHDCIFWLYGLKTSRVLSGFFSFCTFYMQLGLGNIMSLYDAMFLQYGLATAQVLLDFFLLYLSHIVIHNEQAWLKHGQQCHYAA